MLANLCWFLAKTMHVLMNYDVLITTFALPLISLHLHHPYPIKYVLKLRTKLFLRKAKLSLFQRFNLVDPQTAVKQKRVSLVMNLNCNVLAEVKVDSRYHALNKFQEYYEI